MALTKWQETVAIMQELQTLTVADGDLLAQFCRTHSVMLRAQEQIDREGFVIKSFTANGETVKRHPACTEYWQAAAMLTKLLPELGLTPAGRARLKTSPKPDEHNPLVELAKIQ